MVDRKHPATAGLQSPYPVFEEFYRFKNYSPDRVHTILRLADGSPMAWTRTYGAGRVFYTALGHVPAELAHPAAQTILRRGLGWAAR